MAATETRRGFDVGLRRFGMMAAGAVLAVCAGNALTQTAQAQTAQPQSMPAQNPQASIESLHQALQLSPAQEGAWQLYRSASDIPEQAQARRRAASGLFRTLDAPRRMDLVEAEMQQELIDLQRQSRALKTFYGVLTPSQRAIFDARTLPPPGEPQY